MDTLKKLFPFSFKASEVKELIIAIVVYAVIDILCGLVIGLLSKIPLIGILFSLVGSVIGLYALVGIILAILYFAKVIKD